MFFKSDIVFVLSIMGVDIKNENLVVVFFLRLSKSFVVIVMLDCEILGKRVNVCEILIKVV